MNHVYAKHKVVMYIFTTWKGFYFHSSHAHYVDSREPWISRNFCLELICTHNNNIFHIFITIVSSSGVNLHSWTSYVMLLWAGHPIDIQDWCSPFPPSSRFSYDLRFRRKSTPVGDLQHNFIKFTKRKIYKKMRKSFEKSASIALSSAPSNFLSQLLALVFSYIDKINKNELSKWGRFVSYVRTASSVIQKTAAQQNRGRVR